MAFSLENIKVNVQFILKVFEFDSTYIVEEPDQIDFGSKLL